MSAEKLNSWTYLNDPLVKKMNRPQVSGGCLCAWEDFEHYHRTIPAAIALFADRLWNAEEDPAAYDDAYGTAMTHLLFEGKLPEGMNVFACIGNVLPPQQNGVPAHLRMVFADRETLEKTKAALTALEADPLAKTYADAISWVMEEKEKLATYTGPRKDRIAFKG